MEFITENYLWIILIVVVILMAIVGYVAEKKDFIKKGVKVEKSKKEKVEKEQPIVIEDKGIDELLKDAVNNDSKKDKKKNKKEDKVEDVVEPVMEPINEVNSDIDVTAGITDDLMSPLVSEPVNQDNTIDESLFAPLESTEVASELNPIEVSALPEQEPVVNAEEDIWKF